MPLVSCVDNRVSVLTDRKDTKKATWRFEPLSLEYMPQVTPTGSTDYLNASHAR